MSPSLWQPQAWGAQDFDALAWQARIGTLDQGGLGKEDAASLAFHGIKRGRLEQAAWGVDCETFFLLQSYSLLTGTCGTLETGIEQ